MGETLIVFLICRAIVSSNFALRVGTAFAVINQNFVAVFLSTFDLPIQSISLLFVCLENAICLIKSSSSRDNHAYGTRVSQNK